MEKLETLNGFDAAIVLCDLITPTLGTRNSIKCVVEENESYFISETSRLLTALDIKHPIGQYVATICHSFHEKYGCGVKSLLFMIGVFLKIIRNLKNQGVPQDYVLKYMGFILDQCYTKAEELKIPFCHAGKSENQDFLTNDHVSEVEVEFYTKSTIPSSEREDLNCSEKHYDVSLQIKDQQTMASSMKYKDDTEDLPIIFSGDVEEKKGGKNETEIVYLEMKGSCNHGDDDEDLDWLLDDSISKNMLGLSVGSVSDPDSQALQIVELGSMEKTTNTNEISFTSIDCRNSYVFNTKNKQKIHCHNNCSLRNDRNSKMTMGSRLRNVLTNQMTSSVGDSESDDEFADCFEDPQSCKESENAEDIDEFDQCFEDIAVDNEVKQTKTLSSENSELKGKINEISSGFRSNFTPNTNNIENSNVKNISLKSINSLLESLSTKTTKMKPSKILGNSRHYKTIESTVANSRGTLEPMKDLPSVQEDPSVKADKEIHLSTTDATNTNHKDQIAEEQSHHSINTNKEQVDTVNLQINCVKKCQIFSEGDMEKDKANIENQSHKSVDALLQSLGTKSGRSSAFNVLGNSRHFRTIDSTVKSIHSSLKTDSSTSESDNMENIHESFNCSGPNEKLSNKQNIETNVHCKGAEELCNVKGRSFEEDIFRGDNLDCDKGGNLTPANKKKEQALESRAFSTLALSLSHGCEDMMMSLVEFIQKRDNFGYLNIDCICIEGPLSKKPSSVQGVVTTARSEVLSLVTYYGEVPLRMVIVNGDLTHSYKHIGHKHPMKSRTVVSDEVQSMNSLTKWLQSMDEVINMYNIQCLAVRGCVSPDVIDLCFSKQVVVLEKVKFKLLQKLADNTEVTMVTYLSDVTESSVFLAEVGPNSEDWMFKPSSFVYVTIRPSEGSMIQTIILSHPSQNGRDLLEQEFHRCISVLSSALTSGWVVPGNGSTEETIYKYLSDLAQQPSSEIYLPIVYEEVAEGFNSFVQTVRLNAQKSGAGHKDVVDDFKTKIDGWKTAFNAASTISMTEFYIVNGTPGIL